jgi:hypothetical protein
MDSLRSLAGVAKTTAAARHLPSVFRQASQTGRKKVVSCQILKSVRSTAWEQAEESRLARLVHDLRYLVYTFVMGRTNIDIDES